MSKNTSQPSSYCRAGYN